MPSTQRYEDKVKETCFKLVWLCAKEPKMHPKGQGYKLSLEKIGQK